VLLVTAAFVGFGDGGVASLSVFSNHTREPVFAIFPRFAEFMMHRQRLFVAGIISSICVPLTLAAQKAGSVEIGGFGQFTRADAAWHVKNGYGFGGRLGAFFTPRWELEADASFSTFSTEAPRAAGNISQQTFAGRLTYGIPFGMGGRTHHLLLEGGVGGQRFDGHNDFSLSPGGGFRFMLADAVALRLDGIVEYVENPTAATFGFPPVVGVNPTAARSTNVEIRVGLSFLTGNSKPAPAPPPPPPARQETPPPRQETPPPARTEPPPAPRTNTDSINAAARARETLQAVVFFDFDRSELKSEESAKLDAKIPILRANPGVRIRIEGNADERGSDEYNQALGMRRAQAAKKYLTDRGIDAARIDIASYGEERPVCQEHDESCWSRNRRDEFVIVAGGDSIIAPR
jgi:peptidoglycan-associated lipoprotein